MAGNPGGGTEAARVTVQAVSRSPTSPPTEPPLAWGRSDAIDSQGSAPRGLPPAFRLEVDAGRMARVDLTRGRGYFAKTSSTGVIRTFEGRIPSFRLPIMASSSRSDFGRSDS